MYLATFHEYVHLGVLHPAEGGGAIGDLYNQKVHFTTRRLTLQLTYFTTKKHQNYPSVTLTRSFFTTWVGTPRGFLWTRNCVVTFGLAIAGFYLKNLSL